MRHWRVAFAQGVVDELLSKTGRMCAICNRLHGVQVHHIVPRARGGSDEASNAIPLCPNCHDEVHAHYAPGRTTRLYSQDELRHHLARTISLARTSRLTWRSNRRLWTSSSDPYLASRNAAPLTTGADLLHEWPLVRRVLVHFVDSWVLGSSGYGRGLDWLDRKIEAEARLAFRLALLAADEVLVPAACFFQTGLCRRVLGPYSKLFELGSIKLVSEVESWDEFRWIRASQYQPGTPFHHLYESGVLTGTLPSLLGAPETGLHALHSEWIRYINENGLHELEEALASVPRQARLRRDAERQALKVPELIEDRAFVAETVFPLLFEGTDPGLVDVLCSVLSSRFFEVLARGFASAVVTDLAYLNRLAVGAPVALSYRRARALLEQAPQLLGEVRGARPAELIRLRDAPEVRAIVTEALLLQTDLP